MNITDGCQQRGGNERTDTGDLRKSTGEGIRPVDAFNLLRQRLYLMVQFGQMAAERDQQIAKHAGQSSDAAAKKGG